MANGQSSLLFLTAIAAGCGSTPEIVPLYGERNPAVAIPPIDGATPLEVVSRGTGVADPLPVRGSRFVYGDLEAALGSAVVAAASPWAAAHRVDELGRHRRWSVVVEITEADAQLESTGRLIVDIDVRATLRARNGNAYLGQTLASCREGGLVSADHGTLVVGRCIARLGHELAGWLDGGVRLDPPPESD